LASSWVHQVDRVCPHIGVGVEAAFEADRVGLEVAAEAGVVVAVPVLVEAGLGIEELAREAKG
jgi:hypothetical protein